MLLCDKIYTGQLPHSLCLILWYYELNLAGVFDVADLREAHAFSHHYCCEAQGNHLNVFD